jgi:tetratricopeptide (TPR) repeat protein
MALVPPLDTRIVFARQLAADGRWRDVCTVLAPVQVTADVPSELLLLRGEAHLRMGDATGARTWLPYALAVTRARHDRIAERALTNQLGVACFELGILDEAEHAFLQALDLGRRDGDDLLLARASNNMGMIANIRGQRDLAVGHYQLAIPAYQRLGHVRGLAETYHNLALTAREQALLDASDDYERRAIEFAEQAHDDRLQVMGEIGLAEICLLRGDATLAEKRSLRAARRCKELRDSINEADALRAAAAARLAGSRSLGAGRLLDRAVGLAREHGAALIEAESLWERAKFHVAMGNEQFAREDADRALSIFERLGSPQAALVRQWIARLDNEGRAPLGVGHGPEAER